MGFQLVGAGRAGSEDKELEKNPKTHCFCILVTGLWAQTSRLISFESRDFEN